VTVEAGRREAECKRMVENERFERNEKEEREEDLTSPYLYSVRRSWAQFPTTVVFLAQLENGASLTSFLTVPFCFLAILVF
jgi:hypothetical protein